MDSRSIIGDGDLDHLEEYMLDVDELDEHMLPDAVDDLHCIDVSPKLPKDLI